MKYTLFFLLLSNTAFSQITCINELVQEYYAHCDELIDTTVIQEGTATYKFVLSKDSSIVSVPVDTTWNEISQKYLENHEDYDIIGWSRNTTRFDTHYAAPNKYELQTVYKTTVKRKKRAILKRAKPYLFGHIFWDWARTKYKR